MGRPRKNLAKSHYAKLEEWWEQGLSAGDMAKKLDMSESTLRAILKRDERAKRHWEWGRGRRESHLWNVLHDPTVKNKTGAVYELKSRFRYYDKPLPKPDIDESRVKVEVRLPAPLGEREYKELAAKWREERAVDAAPKQIEGEVVRS